MPDIRPGDALGPILPYRPKSLKERLAEEKARLEAMDRERWERIAKMKREFYRELREIDRRFANQLLDKKN